MAFTPPKAMVAPPELKLPTTNHDCQAAHSGMSSSGLTLPVLLSDDQQTLGNKSNFIGCRPVICEQGPSGPNSPTTPRLKRPSPITPEAMRRIHLLTADPAHFTYDPSKLSPISPSLSQYQTSDLGSSPRSSITGSLISPIPMSAFTQFRDMKKSSSDFTDADSDLCKDINSPNSILPSPAPFSPYSDSAFIDAESSPNPLGKRGASVLGGSLSSSNSQRSLYFSFDETNLLSPNYQTRSHGHLSIHRAPSPVPPAMSLLAVPQLARNRSASDSDMTKQATSSADVMDTSVTTSEPNDSNLTGQFKKRLLHKYEQEQMSTDEIQPLADSISSTDLSSTTSTLSSSVPTSNMFASNPSISDALHGPRFDAWMKNQLMAWQSVWYAGQSSSASPSDVNSFLVAAGLIGPSGTSPSVMHPLAPHNSRCGLIGHAKAPGAIKTWRRSRSESDVQSAHVCHECGQTFGVPDRLAKHIASRHRDRSVNRAASNMPPGTTGIGEQTQRHKTSLSASQGLLTSSMPSTSNPTHKPHKCHVCPKSFGRSDMLTRHMRLHTGVKPYACHVCGQEFSRSDHLSTHQRTHTGEKPYQCPQCSYAASRRDMITRHMRTHSRTGGSQVPLIVQRTSSNPIQPSGSSLLLKQPRPPANPLSLSSSPRHHHPISAHTSLPLGTRSITSGTGLGAGLAPGLSGLSSVLTPGLTSSSTPSRAETEQIGRLAVDLAKQNVNSGS